MIEQSASVDNSIQVMVAAAKNETGKQAGEVADKMRQSLPDSAFPGRSWQEPGNEFKRGN